MGQKEDIVKTENKIIVIRDKQVILDRDVAELYGVETKEVNKAVRNNPDKFPDDYIIELTNNEKEEVVKNFHHLSNLKYSDAEKGIMPKEEEQGKIQNLMGEVLADNLPLKMRKMAFSLNLGFLKVSVETTRGKD